MLAFHGVQTKRAVMTRRRTSAVSADIIKFAVSVPGHPGARSVTDKRDDRNHTVSRRPCTQKVQAA